MNSFGKNKEEIEKKHRCFKNYKRIIKGKDPTEEEKAKLKTTKKYKRTQ